MPSVGSMHPRFPTSGMLSRVTGWLLSFLALSASLPAAPANAVLLHHDESGGRLLLFSEYIKSPDPENPLKRIAGGFYDPHSDTFHRASEPFYYVLRRNADGGFIGVN